MTKKLIAHSDYDSGYIDGLTAFAHWENGKQIVGTTCFPLKNAIKDRNKIWNYSPPLKEK